MGFWGLVRGCEGDEVGFWRFFWKFGNFWSGVGFGWSILRWTAGRGKGSRGPRRTPGMRACRWRGGLGFRGRMFYLFWYRDSSRSG